MDRAGGVPRHWRVLVAPREKAIDHAPADARPVNKDGSGLVLLRTNMGAGHGGAAGCFDRLEDVAIAYAFALTVTQT
jgi:hypothetical protein